jgi:lysophospholipase L1-like esterase
MAKRSRTRRFLFGSSFALAALIILFGAQVLIAVRGPGLPSSQAFDLRKPSDSPDAKRVVWLGDSTAAGVGASGESSTVPIRVAEQNTRPVDLHVLAVSGARIADVEQHQLPAVADLQPDVVYISIGANDTTGRTSRSAFRSNYERVLAGLPEQAEVVLLGVPDMGSPPRIPQPLRAIVGKRGQQLDGIVADIAREMGATYVDIAGFTGAKFRDHPSRYFAGDKFHPSDDGYKLWADAVTETTNKEEARNGK